MAINNQIGFYVELSPKERIDYLYTHYRYFPEYLTAYEQSIFSIIEAMRSYERKCSDDLGVRVQTSDLNPDRTYKEAVERICINNCLKSGRVTEDVISNNEDRALINLALFEMELLKREVRLFTAQIGLLTAIDRDIVTAYITRNKNLWDIAHDLSIEKESAEKRLYRIKRKLVKQAIPYFREIEYISRKVS